MISTLTCCADEHAVTQEFIDSLFSYMLIPIITRPTRLTAHTATLIDNIFTNCLTQIITNGIIINDISDHLPIFASFNNEKLPYTKTMGVREGKKLGGRKEICPTFSDCARVVKKNFPEKLSKIVVDGGGGE